MNADGTRAGSAAWSEASGRQAEAGGVAIEGLAARAELVVPAGAKGVAIVFQSCGCIRETPLAATIPHRLAAAGLATLALPLLSAEEGQKDHHAGSWSFDLDLLTLRVLRITQWVRRNPATRDLGIGYCGASTFAAAALMAAGQLGYAVQAVVSRAGRPDFAGDWLAGVTAPTLLIVGEKDEGTLMLNRSALARLTCRKQLAVIPGAGHLFDEAGALEQVARLAADWFTAHLKPIRRR